MCYCTNYITIKNLIEGTIHELFESKLNWNSVINETPGLKSTKYVLIKWRVKLHRFCGSSGKAFGAVVYGSVNCCGGIKTSLLSSILLQ